MDNQVEKTEHEQLKDEAKVLGGIEAVRTRPAMYIARGYMLDTPFRESSIASATS